MSVRSAPPRRRRARTGCSVKSVKIVSLISLTVVLLQECFYIKYDVMQCLHLIIMNTILFGAHIENIWTFNRFKKNKTFFRSAIMVKI